MNVGMKRKLRSTRRLNDNKVKGRNAEAQGALVRLWFTQASAAVQMEQAHSQAGGDASLCQPGLGRHDEGAAASPAARAGGAGYPGRAVLDRAV